MQKTMLLGVLLLSLTMTGQIFNSHQLNVDESVIKWKGSYSFLMTSYEGTVKFTSGELHTKQQNITGGSFLIDMTTIAGGGPVDHLRDEDFFDVMKHPRAQLNIMNVEYIKDKNVHIITADLTIKEVTKDIVFNAYVDGNTKTFSTTFKIDRTRWGVTYNNPLKNNAISDAIEFDVFLQFETEN